MGAAKKKKAGGGITPPRAPTPPMAPGTDSEDTAAEWARRRGRQWVTRYVDVIHGFARQMDLTEMLLRVGLATLAVYAVYLALCESCKSEYLELITSLYSALVDFATLTQGETSAAVAFSLIVWLLTVKFMRGSSPIYLIDFKTYRHKNIGGPAENTAGCPVVYERFFEESRAARHPDTNPTPSPSPNSNLLTLALTLTSTLTLTQTLVLTPAPTPTPTRRGTRTAASASLTARSSSRRSSRAARASRRIRSSPRPSSPRTRQATGARTPRRRHATRPLEPSTRPWP